MKIEQYFALVVVWLAVVVPARAQEGAPIVIHRLAEPIRFDGLSTEPAWEDVPPLEPVMYEPTFGQPPSERTEIRIAYDEQYLYFALRGYDRDPSGVRGNILHRDRFGGDDYFEVMLDTFNDNENAVIFTTSPTGMRRDTEISRDASGTMGSWLNPDFNTYWDAETVVTDEGWFAEMRIPFSSLRFRDVDGRVEMGLIAHRIIARRSERSTFPAVEPNVSFAFLKPSRAQTIVFEGIYSRRPLYVSPYLLSGMERGAVWRDGEGAFGHAYTREAEVGGDLKVGLTNELTLDLTVNTDFAQVEADDQQLNLTRFSLFFPEKRQFFQERAGLFEFRMGGQGRLFHSRRIGLTEAGEQVRILGGARVVGRMGAWDVGLLDLQTGAAAGLPSENFGVLRLRRRAFNDYSHAGGMMTSRVGADGGVDLALGVDGTFRLAGDEYLTVHWAQTVDERRLREGRPAPGETGRLAVTLERRRQDGFGYGTDVVWSAKHFDPAIGFVQRRDFSQVEQRMGYTWRPGEASPFIHHAAVVRGAVIARNADGTVETVEAGPSWEFNLKSGGRGSIGTFVLREHLLDGFSIGGGVDVPAGTFTFYRAGASYMMSRSRLLRAGVRVETGSFYDGTQTTVGFSPTWSVSRHLELTGTYLYNRLRFEERAQALDGHIVRLRASAALNTELSTDVFVQFNSAASALTANARFRYNMREGNDLWIVYNEGVHTDPGGGAVRLPWSQTRTLLLKYTHTLRLNS